VLRTALAWFHFVLGGALCVAGFSVMGDDWKAPAFFFLGVGGVALAVGLGVREGALWARGLVWALMAAAAVMGLFLLAGSVAWSASAGGWILTGTGAAVGIEALTLSVLRPKAEAGGAGEGRH
jgi:hypothetical protein